MRHTLGYRCKKDQLWFMQHVQWRAARKARNIHTLLNLSKPSAQNLQDCVRTVQLYIHRNTCLYIHKKHNLVQNTTEFRGNNLFEPDLLANRICGIQEAACLINHGLHASFHMSTVPTLWRKSIQKGHKQRHACTQGIKRVSHSVEGLGWGTQ